MMPKELVNLENDVIPLLIFNITDRPQVLYEDSLVCMCEHVSEIMDFSQQNPPSVTVNFAGERIICDLAGSSQTNVSKFFREFNSCRKRQA